MLNRNDILETINMIHTDHLDIRTITMGISLLDCASDDAAVFAGKIYDKITRRAEKLVETGLEIEKEYGIPIHCRRRSGPGRAQTRRLITRQGRESYRRQFYWRLFGACSKRLFSCGRRPYCVDTGGACRDEAGMLVGKRRLNKGRHKHGCR